MKEKLTEIWAVIAEPLARSFILAVILTLVAFIPIFMIDRYGVWLWLIPATWGAWFNPAMAFLHKLLGEIYGRPKI